MPPLPRKKPVSFSSEVEEIRGEVVDFMVRLFRLMGLPRTVGAIYGYVYASPQAVSMEEVVGGLEISMGSASQGLRTLRVFRAIRQVPLAGARREYYEAETDFHKFVGGFLRGELEQYIENTSRRTERMHARLERLPEGEEKEFCAQRIEKLASMNERATALLPLLSEIFVLSDQS